METINAIGRRKASVARVYLTKGGGNITINGKELSNYFPMQNIQNSVTEPLKVSELEKQYDIKINVSGGGFKGQAEAIRLGISRALVKIDEENKPALKPCMGASLKKYENTSYSSRCLVCSLNNFLSFNM